MATVLCDFEDTVDIAIYVNGTPWGCVLNTESLMMVPLGAVFLPGEFHEEPGRPELDMTEQLTHTHTRFSLPHLVLMHPAHTLTCLVPTCPMTHLPILPQPAPLHA